MPTISVVLPTSAKENRLLGLPDCFPAQSRPMEKAPVTVPISNCRAFGRKNLGPNSPGAHGGWSDSNCGGSTKVTEALLCGSAEDVACTCRVVPKVLSSGIGVRNG